MARRRRPPSTPFGAWLDHWLDENREWTLAALGQEIGVTNSAISLWLSGETKKIGIEPLRQLARLTGEPLDNLERLAYGAGTRRSDPAGPIDMTLITATIERTIRDALSNPAPSRALRPSEDSDEMAARRAYWMLTARKIVLRATEGAIAKRLGLKAADVKAWENGRPIPDGQLVDVAEAYELPVDVLRNPPETDVDVAKAFRFRWLAEQRTASTEEVGALERLRAAG